MFPLSNLSLFADVTPGQLPACSVLSVILVAFWKNRQFHYGACGWYAVFQQLDVTDVTDLLTRT